MADALDRVQKLISLALNNPDEEEARSAAMKAVSLIVQQNMSIDGSTAGTNVDPSRIRRAWKPDEEFDSFWDNIVKDTKKGFTSQDDIDRDAWAPQPTQAGGIKAAHVDTDVEDAFSAMRNRIKIAWRAIQRERAKLKTEIYRWEQRYREKYPRQNPEDWEREDGN
jgi:hypothetical protein